MPNRASQSGVRARRATFGRRENGRGVRQMDAHVRQTKHTFTSSKKIPTAAGKYFIHDRTIVTRERKVFTTAWSISTLSRSLLTSEEQSFYLSGSFFALSDSLVTSASRHTTKSRMNERRLKAAAARKQSLIEPMTICLDGNGPE